VLVDRSAARVLLHSLTLSVDAADTLEFSQLVEPAGDGDYSEGDPVHVVVDGVSRFTGMIARALPINIGTGSIAVGYLALGLRYLANQIFITAPDGTGYLQWNLPPTDPNWVQSNAGKSIGDILKEALDLHAAQLSAVGVFSYDPTQLAALTVVPPDAVTFSGRLWDQMSGLLAQWCPNHAIWPDGTGQVQVQNMAALSQQTLTLDSDPIVIDGITKDHSECFTQVVLRGRADIQGAYLSLHEHTLKAGWTHADQLSWTITQFFSPVGAFDQGNILAQTSDTLTIQSDDPTMSWAVNFWNNIEAFVWAYNPLATDITFTEQEAITATTSLAAGGTSTITVSPPFSNTGYTRYQIRGNRTEESLVWRKFEIVPDYVANHLARAFNHSVPWSPVDGMVVQTLTPTGVVCWSSSGLPPYNEFPWPFELVLPDGTNPGYIIFMQPICMAYASRTQLETGGAAVPAPGDVRVLVPYSRGPLQVTVPTLGDGTPTYGGTAFTEDGIERTLYKDYPQWLDKGAVALMTELANQILFSRQDTVYEGSVTYHGKYSAGLTLGWCLNIASADGLTGWESIKAAARSVTLLWPQTGASIWKTKINFSSRRRPFTGDRLYLHPGYRSQPQIAQGWNPFGLTVQGMRALTQARQQQFEQDYLSTAGAYEGFESSVEFQPRDRNTWDRRSQYTTEKEQQHIRAQERNAQRRESVEAQRQAHAEARAQERPAEEEARVAKARAYNDRIAKQKEDEALAREGKLPAAMQPPDDQVAQQ
jgi:hypothetical protein